MMFHDNLQFGVMRVPMFRKDVSALEMDPLRSKLEIPIQLYRKMFDIIVLTVPRGLLFFAIEAHSYRKSTECWNLKVAKKSMHV